MGPSTLAAGLARMQASSVGDADRRRIQTGGLMAGIIGCEMRWAGLREKQ